MTTATEIQNRIAVIDDMDRERGSWFTEGSYVHLVTVAPAYHGRIVAITPTMIYLEGASWVVDSGRAHTYVRNPSSAGEIEFIGEIAVPRGAIVAAYRVNGEGALETK